jgi:uncharacterized protein YyaL (SSP411 family)
MMFNTCSPYLKLLFDKGIDWYPYLDQKLIEKAEKEDKLIFQHIGYISNMKVREMAERLFSDPRVINILNDNFICIVEDKESSPESYLIALDLLFLNQDFSFGPMNLFVMPDRKPIICFSDCNPEYFLEVAGSIVEAKKNKKYLLKQLSEELSKSALNTGIITEKVSPSTISSKILDTYMHQWSKGIAENDFIYQITPFTPNPSMLLTIVEYLKFYKDKTISDKIESMLDHLQFSSVFDPIGGGFFKQAKDYSCKEPFYEKTLEDNAHFINLYANAHDYFKKESYKITSLMTYKFIKDELATQSGGYKSSTTITSSLDEVNYYKYSINELMIMFPERYIDVAIALSLDPLADKHLKQIPARTSRTYSILSDDEIEKLKIRRTEHIGYFADRREITSYMSQLAESLASSSLMLNDRSLYETALNIVKYILINNSHSDGRLYRYCCCNKSNIPGYLSDYADFIAALIELYKSDNCKNQKLFDYAKKYIDFVMTHFYKPENGMFNKSECSIEPNTIPFKRESNIDFLKPSANSIMAGNLLSFYEITGDKEYFKIAEQQIMNIAPNLHSSGPMLSSWAHKVLKYLNIISKLT